VPFRNRKSDGDGSLADRGQARAYSSFDTGGSTSETADSASGSARSSAAVGNSSGLIWPSSRSHSFDQLENQPKSVDALRQAPKPCSDAASSGSAFSVSASQ
jgi:hypothetical protein